MERAFLVTPHRVEMYCDVGECAGTMEPTGAVLACYPPRYVHTCRMCGRTENYNKSYPYIDYR